MTNHWVDIKNADVVISSWIGFETNSAENAIAGTNGANMSLMFKAQAEGILPYTQQTPFTVADAYLTDGKVMAVEDVPITEETTPPAWQQELDKFTDKAKKEVKDVGGKVFEKTKDILRGLRDRLPEIGR